MTHPTIQPEGRQRILYWLSAVIIVLAAVASLGGILIDDLYRDNAFTSTVWRATDLITLVLAVPIFITALILPRRGSVHGQLIWLAMLDYMLYNYAYYLFGAAFNTFFLIYVVIFTLSIYTLIFSLVSLDVSAISQRFGEKTPVKWIAGFMLFIALGLTIVYAIQSVAFITNGTLPSIIETTGHPTCIVFALDLSLLVPPLVLGAIWVWKRRPWGYLLAAVLMVKGAVYMLVLAFGSWQVSRVVAPEAAAEIPLWVILGIGSATAAVFLLVNLKSER